MGRQHALTDDAKDEPKRRATPGKPCIEPDDVVTGGLAKGSNGLVAAQTLDERHQGPRDKSRIDGLARLVDGGHDLADAGGKLLELLRAGLVEEVAESGLKGGGAWRLWRRNRASTDRASAV